MTDFTDNDFVGMKVDDARTRAAERGLRLRVRTLDGKAMVGTMDYNTNRVNVSVTDGVVTAVGRRG